MHGPNFVFPNAEVAWSLMIVLYPYITGLVAGAFIVSALYHVAHKKELKPIARLALVASFCFCSFATLPLLLHLHHPERAFNVMFTPNFTSAMAGFGFIYSFYMVVLIIDLWLVFRQDFIDRAKSLPGVMGLLYKVLALGVLEMTPKARAIDKKLIHFFSVIGIPAACVLHGYVGFIFGGVKANPWWSTALMPVVFLLSAIVSGLAALVVIYMVISKIRKAPIDLPCFRSLLNYTWLVLIVAVSLETLELANRAYEGGHEWEMLSTLITDHLTYTYIPLQLIVGSVIPILLLPFAFRAGANPKFMKFAGVLAGLLILVQVFSMRWNVVIGGQLFSKSFRGFIEWEPEFLGREGILMAIIVLCLPFITLAVVHKFLPVWGKDRDDTDEEATAAH